MVPQMNEMCKDSYERMKQARRDQLIQTCLQNGMLVAGNEDEDTLEMYIEMAYDDDFDGWESNDEDGFDLVNSNVESEQNSKRRLRR
jgi:hypothetical protein